MDDRPESTGTDTPFRACGNVMGGLAFFTERHEAKSKGPRLKYIEPHQETVTIFFRTPSDVPIPKNVHYVNFRVENDSETEPATDPQLHVAFYEEIDKSKKSVPVYILNKAIGPTTYRWFDTFSEMPAEDEFAHILATKVLTKSPDIPELMIGGFLMCFAFENGNVFYFITEDPSVNYFPHPVGTVWTLVVGGRASSRFHRRLAELEKQTVRMVLKAWDKVEFQTVEEKELDRIRAERVPKMK